MGSNPTTSTFSRLYLTETTHWTFTHSCWAHNQCKSGGEAVVQVDYTVIVLYGDLEDTKATTTDKNELSATRGIQGTHLILPYFVVALVGLIFAM